MSNPSSKRGLIILSTARTTSTLFMRLLSQPLERNHHPGTIHLEPSTVLFHLDHNPLAPNFHPHPSLPQTPSSLQSLLHNTLNSSSRFVIKDLAYQIAPYLTDDLVKTMSDIAEIVFLVRDPVNTIPSGMYPYLQKGEVEKDDKVVGYNGWEAGFVELKGLFERFMEVGGVTPWVVEAERYLEDPEKVVGDLCEKWKWPWCEEYLKFVDKEVVCGKGGVYEKEVGVWGEVWYGKAFSCKGVNKKGMLSRKNTKKGKYERVWNVAEDLLVDLLEGHVPAYRFLIEEGKRLEVDLGRNGIAMDDGHEDIDRQHKQVMIEPVPN